MDGTTRYPHVLQAPGCNARHVGRSQGLKPYQTAYGASQIAFPAFQQTRTDGGTALNRQLVNISC